ncbi:MAG TPA: molybdopterin-binding protein, partial [Syntrophothermus lipocalidus]|nr:molybdopterin-binding protein [Syntrophothermus lipocalidus]
MVRRVYIDNKPLEEAFALLWTELENAGFFVLEGEEVDVEDALGRITVVPVVAKRSSPHYSASAMDGIAVKAKDTFSASDTSPIVLKRGEQFIEVDTGDYVPGEFDAVIMIEDVNFLSHDEAEIIAPAVPWQHIRSVGEDVIASQMIIPSLYVIGAYEIGAMLTSGVTKVQVVKKPRVGIIPTGTELVEPGGKEPEPGEIIESNSRMLASLCRKWGAEPCRYPLVADDKEKIKEAVLRCASQTDIIVVCSGSSAGREDFTAEIVQEAGRLLVHGLATKPGKPAILGLIEGKPVIGVPGYPVSAALVFELLARPLIYR